MKIERFQSLADSLGGDLKRWPQAERAAAEALADSDPQAAATLAEAQRLDALLAQADAAPVDDLFTARLMRDARAAVRGPYPRRALFAQAAAVLVCLMGGVVAGGLGDSEPTLDDATLVWAMGAPAENWGAGE